MPEMSRPPKQTPGSSGRPILSRCLSTRKTTRFALLSSGHPHPGHTGVSNDNMDCHGSHTIAGCHLAQRQVAIEVLKEKK